MRNQNPFAKPGVYRGDDVYFDCPSGPISGRVLASGKHGCTIECGKGRRHRVKWGKILGHKKRSEVSYNVVEEGEDGMIVTDSSGRRRFINIPAAEHPSRIPIGQAEAIHRENMKDAAASGGDPDDQADEDADAEVVELSDDADAPEDDAQDPESEPVLRKSVPQLRILLWSGRF